MNGQLCEAVIKRDKWVEHLKKKAEHTAKVTYNNERATMILNTTYKTAMEGNLIPDRETLVTRIGNMIKSTNNNWSEKSRNGSFPGHISMHNYLRERGSCLLRTCFKSWQLNHFTWSYKSKGDHKSQESVWLKGTESKFAVENWSTRLSTFFNFSLFDRGINTESCSHTILHRLYMVPQDLFLLNP